MEYTANLGLKLPGPGDDILDETGAPKDINDNMAALDEAVMPKNIFATIDPANGFVDRVAARPLPYGANLNNYRLPEHIGKWYTPTATIAGSIINHPVPGSQFSLEVKMINSEGNPGIIQELQNATGVNSSSLYTRNYFSYTSVWNAWIHGVMSSGDTMTGDLIIQKIAPAFVFATAVANRSARLVKNADDGADYGIYLEDSSSSGARLRLILRASQGVKDGFAVTDVANTYRIYHEGNTGIDSGSNANGNWIKWPDGTMVCTKKITASAAMTTAYGALYVTSAAIGLGDWPQVFVGSPVVNCHSVTEGVIIIPWASPSVTACGSIKLAMAVSGTKSVEIHITGTGRWK